MVLSYLLSVPIHFVLMMLGFVSCPKVLIYICVSRVILFLTICDMYLILAMLLEYVWLLDCYNHDVRYTTFICMSVYESTIDLSPCFMLREHIHSS